MGQWQHHLAILCCLGFFKMFKPSEPFLTPYLKTKGFSSDVLDSQIYPISLYSQAISLFFVLLTTDIVQYKPIIILESVGFLITRLLLIFGSSVVSMQLMQVAYGFASACQVAYWSILYRLIPCDKYHLGTSLLRASHVFGECLQGVVGQLLVSQMHSSYLTLLWISFSSICAMVLLALMIPWPPKQNKARPLFHIKTAVKVVLDPSVQFWFVPLMLVVCGDFLVGNYVQTLWELEESSNRTENGYAVAASTGLSVVTALFAGGVHQWLKNANVLVLLVTLFALLIASFCLGCSATAMCSPSIFSLYALYCGYRCMYSFAVTMFSSELARVLARINVDQCQPQEFAFYFGLNTLLGLGLSCIVSGAATSTIDIRTQFLVFGGVVLLAAVFMIMTSCVCKWNSREVGEEMSNINVPLIDKEVATHTLS